MKIESRDTTVRSLLKSSYYLVPRFQRPYSWEIENIEDFWADTVQESQGDYFIGAMVVYPHTKDTYAVVDGQQRLTTIVLLMCALREAFREHEDPERADGTHGFVERADEDNEHSMCSRRRRHIRISKIAFSIRTSRACRTWSPARKSERWPLPSSA